MSTAVVKPVSDTSVFLDSLGFNSGTMSPDESNRIATSMITIFKNANPDQPLNGSFLEHCRIASSLFKDWPSIIFLDKFLPTHEPRTVSLEDQKSQYINRGTNQIYNNIFNPIPIDAKESWSEERIIKHLQEGNPVYFRLIHKEDEMRRYSKIKDAILPSRQNITEEYNPIRTIETLNESSLCALNDDGERFTPETEAKIKEIQTTRAISRVEAIFQMAKEQNKNRKNYPEIGPLRSIFWELFTLHATCCMTKTPFKGMIGGTIEDPLFIDEMARINLSFAESSKIVVVIDFSGRFLHNPNNPDQKREFLAIGGILNSEIVAEFDKSNFQKLIAKAVNEPIR